MMDHVIISINDGTPIVNAATIKRSASNLITTADISLPYHKLSTVQDNAEVAIEFNNKVLFHGIVTDNWALQFDSGGVSMSVPCTDLSYKLSHMLSVSPMSLHSGTAQAGSSTTITLESGAETTDDYYNGFFVEIIYGTGYGQINQISDYDGTTLIATMADTWATTPDNTSKYRMFRGYAAGTDIGAAVYDLLADTGIDRSHVNTSTGVTLDDNLEITISEMRQTTIQQICKTYGFLFWLSYGKPNNTYTTYAEFDDYDTMEASSEFTESHTITESNVIIFSTGIKSVPEMVCTRVIAVRDNAGVQEIGVATSGSAPYLDKIVQIEATNETDIDTLASSYLANFQRGVTSLEMSFKDLSIGLFNILDISGLSNLIGDALDLTEYRVTDITYTIENNGVLSSVTAIDPDAELWDPATRDASTQADIGQVIQSEAEYQAEEAKPVYAVVVE